jgi:proteasome beta subunit
VASASRSTSASNRAAEEDSATGGPDLIRGIFPVVATITAAGYERVDDAELRTRVEAIVAGGTSA